VTVTYDSNQGSGRGQFKAVKIFLVYHVTPIRSRHYRFLPSKLSEVGMRQKVKLFTVAFVTRITG